MSSLFRPDLAAFGLGGGELMIILAIFLLLFGGAKLPSLARGLGQSIKEFKKSSKEDPEKTEAEKLAEAKGVDDKKRETANTHGAN